MGPCRIICGYAGRVSEPFEADPILIEVERGGLVESVHRARVVVTDTEGEVAGAIGAVDAPMYPRSSSKPMQAIGMLRAGLDLSGELLALAAASHSGESFHLAGVRTILDGAGLDESALQTPPDYPVDDLARDEWTAAGHAKAPITMNCSGKHAAMLRTCVRGGWPTETYRNPDHPLQVALRGAIGDLTGTLTTHPTTDGCGAPLFAVPLTGLARAFGRIAAATDGPEHAVAQAYREHPEYVSGTRREEVDFHRAVPGSLCKVGAEGVYALGLPDGRGIAIKVDDGPHRGRAPLLAAVLQHLGFGGDDLAALLTEPVLGHGEPVGSVRVKEGSLAAL